MNNALVIAFLSVTSYWALHAAIATYIEIYKEHRAFRRAYKELQL